MRPLTVLVLCLTVLFIIIAALCFHPNLNLRLDDSSEWSVSASTSDADQPIGSQPEGIPAIKEPAAHGGKK